MNKRLFASILALATASMLAIGCGSTEEHSDGWIWADITESEPGLGAAYLESETSWAGEVENDLLESEAPCAKKIENDLMESEAPVY